MEQKQIVKSPSSQQNVQRITLIEPINAFRGKLDCPALSKMFFPRDDKCNVLIGDSDGVRIVMGLGGGKTMDNGGVAGMMGGGGQKYVFVSNGNANFVFSAPFAELFYERGFIGVICSDLIEYMVRNDAIDADYMVTSAFGAVLGANLVKGSERKYNTIRGGNLDIDLTSKSVRAFGDSIDYGGAPNERVQNLIAQLFEAVGWGNLLEHFKETS